MRDTRESQASSARAPAATPGAAATASVPSGANIQLKQSLAGRPFAEQEAMLAPVQMKGGGGTASVHEAAQRGTAGGGGALPHGDKIQAAFGRHDVGNVQAHTGAQASQAADAMGASAYATGNKVAFKGAPDLHTAAHEAAHIVQQRAGVSLAGGVGASGDAYERHADQVADAVVAGKSAEGLLDQRGPKGGEGGGGAVQHKVQMEGETVDQLAEQILQAVQTDYKNSPVRVNYETEVAGLKTIAANKLSGKDKTNDASLEGVAREMNQLRLDIGKKYKAQTILPLRDYILFANSQRYDTEYGPSYEFLQGKGKTNMQIIDGSSRPNPDINSFLAPFGQWLKSQSIEKLREYKGAVG